MSVEREGAPQPEPNEQAQQREDETPRAWDIEAIAESLKAEPDEDSLTPWPYMIDAVLFEVGKDRRTRLTLAPHREWEGERKRAYVHVEDVSLEFRLTAPPMIGEEEVVFINDSESRRSELSINDHGEVTLTIRHRRSASHHPTPQAPKS